jgi:hypothetical protein
MSQSQPNAGDSMARGEELRQTPQGSRPRPSWLERIDVLAKLALSVAGLLLSGAIGFATIRYNQQAAQRQIQSQENALALQRRVTAVQMLVSHLPTVLRGNEQDRALTLKLLEIVDPSLVRQIGERLLAQAKSPAAVEQAKQIIVSSLATGREDAVARHMENARKYRDFGLNPAAAREYIEAYEALAAPVRERLKKPIQNATSDYEAGDYAGAVQTLEAALRDVEGQK